VTDLQASSAHLHQPLRSGGLLGSRYRLEGVAGAGGMATVWRGYDERLQRPVAIKFISDELSTNPAAVARFAREARTHARIQHPNLVQVYDYSVTAAQPYLVMEYINGCTLSQRLDRGLSPATIQALAVELLSAIACVHNHGVLHRDIKTGNVLIDKDGHARLTDFGLARLEDSTQITRTHEVVGTLRFLAPELIEGQPASRQSDLYALGVLLRTVTRDTDVNPPLPRLITWLTEPDPSARPSDAQAVLTALRSEAPAKPGGSKPRPTEVADVTKVARATKAADVRQTAQAPRRDAPTKPLRITERRQYSTRRQLRNRTAAVSALLVAVAGTALAVIDAGGGNASPKNSAAGVAGKTVKAGSKTRGGSNVSYNKASAQSHTTIDEQLQQLASGVRRAAAKRP
jgi:eukaryotic-like serine/threonine-protein kinase